MTLQTLQNERWQVGVLPETGSSIAFGRANKGGQWIDVLRPTAEQDYGNASLCSSFIMLPWANRLRDAKFRYNGHEYQLQPSSNDGTAIHGTVRRLPWQVASADQTHLVTHFDSVAFPPDKINFPFQFSARAEYRLSDVNFSITVTLTNEDRQEFPAGFGHHPYFVRDPENKVEVQVNCQRRFELVNALATAPAASIPPEKDFRRLRPLGTATYEDLFAGRTSETAARIVYPDTGIGLTIHADLVFGSVLLFAPEGKPFFAVEPQSNANDGFNLLDKDIAGNGVFILAPGEAKAGTVIFRLEN